MPIALDTLPMGEEALWDQIVLGAGHRDIKKWALLLELEHRRQRQSRRTSL